jgi:pimeloyl-ACP methyl ester carboxylesterase
MTGVYRALSHRWKVAARPFTVWARDDVRLVGSRLGAQGSEAPAVVLAHGLMGWHRKPKFARFAETLVREGFAVYCFDFRGHGGSEGVCDYGGAEIEDVDAVVRLARGDGHAEIATCGLSMGAIAAVRHAGLKDGVDAVVAISSLAYWEWRDGAAPSAARAMRARIGTPTGRTALRAWGTRLPGTWNAQESPEEVVGRISPASVVIFHGRNDGLFGEDHAMRLFAAAHDPRRLFLSDSFGHAEEGVSDAFAKKVAEVLREELAR